MTPVTHAMIMAAGMGQRMRPLTDDRPKPLIRVGARTLLDHGLDRLLAVGVHTVVVNVHYLGGQIIDHLAARKTPRIIISDESGELLNTGGGIKKALPHLGTSPFFTLNTDALWIDGARPALAALAAAFDPEKMDALLLLAPTHGNIGFTGAGDFFCDAERRLARRGGKPGAPFVYAGVTLTHPRLFAGAPEGAFSTNLLWDKAIQADRLFGHVLDGRWMHVGTPDAVAQAKAVLDG